MDRNFSRLTSRFLVFAFGAVLLSTASGCGLLAMGGSIFNDGKDVPPEYTHDDGLEGKRVVVVCRATGTSSFLYAHVPANLAEAVASRLKTNVKKIKIVDSQEVADWTDHNSSQPYSEIGEALKADIVIGIDLDDFRLKDGQTLYRGRAQVSLRVYDMKSDEPDDVVWKKTIPQVKHPEITPVPADGNLGEFRREFVSVLADRIAKKFYAHEFNKTFALGRAR